jgi:hypothetical protein
VLGASTWYFILLSLIMFILKKEIGRQYKNKKLLSIETII